MAESVSQSQIASSIEIVTPVREKTLAPRRVLSTRDGVVMVVGLIVGAGIFRAPPIVAANVSDGAIFLLTWVGGGAIALIGALCYAELAGAYPHAGGEYHVLRRAFGKSAAFLLGWSRLTVLQTGSIALLAFLFSDYAVRLLSLDDGGMAGWGDPAIAALIVIVLTAVNAAGLHPGRRTQYILTAGEFLGLLTLIVAGCLVVIRNWPFAPTPLATIEMASDPGSTVAESRNLALAFVFVLLTYGGWSEAAYLSAEFRDKRRGVQRTLIGGVIIVTLLYVLTNLAYMSVLRLEGVAQSTAVAVDVMEIAMGSKGAIFVGVLVMFAALSSVNATMITGARGSFAVGRDIPVLSSLGIWHAADDESGTPRRALLVQGVVSLLLVAFGAITRSGFETMVAYTAPVFWLTLLLMGIALFVLRVRDPTTPRPFRVPWYPITPLLFSLTSAAMLYSSIAYAGRGAILGVVVMLAGIPVLIMARRTQGKAPHTSLDHPVPTETLS